MNNYLTTAVLKEENTETELNRILRAGSPKEKEHALMNIALSNENDEKALDLFLKCRKDPDTETVAYRCINKFLESSRKYNLTKVLPALIEGISNEKEAVRYHSQCGLDNLIKPANLKEGALSFDSFQLNIRPGIVKEYLNSDSSSKIIMALLYVFHRPHKDRELFKILEKQLVKDIAAVDCIIGAIIDTKLSAVIKSISELGELSLNSYALAQKNGLKSKASWVYRRFDSIRELAREHLSVMQAGAQ